MTTELMGVYGEPLATLVEGSGCWVSDVEGRRYLDLLAGIAVNSLGHCHPELTEALSRQLGRLTHTSNFFVSGPLAAALAALDGVLPWDESRVFFANSGTEATEAAIKLLRRAVPERPKVVCFEGSFHGRTLGALSATMQPAKQAPFAPLLPGFVAAPIDDPGALARALEDPQVGAVLFEPILGEAGVRLLAAGVGEVLAAAQARGVLLVADEIQCGLGRTGSWFGFEALGLVPDAILLGKALGNGFPVAALTARASLAQSFQPGDHGSTYGGNPVALTAVATVLGIMRRDDLPGAAGARGEELRNLAAELPGVQSVEGRGLMLGLELAEPRAREVVRAALGLGLIVNATGPSRLRLTPPLVISSEEVAEGARLLAKALKEAGA